MSAASEELEISRFSIYDWRRKLKKASAGQGSSPTSGSFPQTIEEQRDQEILGEWRKHPGLGAEPDPEPAAAARHPGGASQGSSEARRR